MRYVGVNVKKKFTHRATAGYFVCLSIRMTVQCDLDMNMIHDITGEYTFPPRMHAFVRCKGQNAGLTDSFASVFLRQDKSYAS